MWRAGQDDGVLVVRAGFKVAFDGDGGPWRCYVAGYGRCDVTAVQHAAATALGRRGMLRRMADVGEGYGEESKATMRLLRTLPDVVLACVVGDVTFPPDGVDWP